MGNCSPPQRQCQACPDRSEQGKLLDQAGTLVGNGLRRENSGELGEEDTKRAMSDIDNMCRQNSCESKRSQSSEPPAYRSQASHTSIGSRQSLRPNVPASRPGLHRLSSLNSLATPNVDPEEDLGVVFSRSLSNGCTDLSSNALHSKELERKESVLRDLDEEFHERKAEFAEHYPEGEVCSPHGPSGKMGSRGIIKGGRQIESVMRRLVRLSKSKSSNNLNPDSQSPASQNQSPAVRINNAQEVKEFDMMPNKIQFSDEPIPDNEVQEPEEEVPRGRSFSSKAGLRRSRSLLIDIGTRRPSMALQLIIENPRDIDIIYTLDRRELGAGSFGSVRKATVKATGAVRAVKSISKDRMKDTMSLLKMEIRITKMVDHPNIIKLYELFEDVLNVHMVMELCSGGQLHDFVSKRGHLSEPQVCFCMKQILRAVVYLHNHHICHRDLKPENVLLASEDPIMYTSLKLTDFGVSCLFKQKQTLNARVGTSAYMAPEVIKKCYNERCDVWSVGVTMYFLFCGSLPFFGKDIEEIRQRVCSGVVEFTKEFVDVSEDGCDMMQKLMQVDHHTRPTAKQSLRHKWFDKQAPKTKQIVIPSTVFDALRIFRSQNKFKKAALCLIASLLSKEQLSAAHEAFVALDKDGDGIVSVAEIRDNLRKDSAKMSIPGVDRILRDMDRACRDHFEDCTYTEFLAANLDRERYIQEAVCRAAFSVFDQDCDGFITKAELTAGEMFGKMTEPEVAALVSDLATKGHDHIEFQDFMKMMQEVPEVPKSVARSEKPEKPAKPARGLIQKAKATPKKMPSPRT